MPETPPLYPSPGQRFLVGAALCLLMGAELLYLMTDAAALKVIAGLSFVAFAAIGASRFGLRELALFSVATGMSVAMVALNPDGLADVVQALSQAAFLGAFILLMALLREAAATSPAVRLIGAWLTKQPPGRRYLAMHNGGHGLGVLLNFGAISLLSPLIQQGIASSDAPDEVKQIRERRLLSALLRGFSWIVLWSPTAVTQALLAGMFSTADPAKIVLGGLAISGVMMLVGWAEDTLRWKRTAAQLRANRQGSEPLMPLPKRAALDLLTVIAVLAATVFAIRAALDIRTVYALMITAPLGLVGWSYIQARAKVAEVGSVGAKLKGVFEDTLPNGAREAATLGASAFLGVAMAALLPEEVITPLVTLGEIDPGLFLAALPTIVLISCQFGVTPIVMVVFLGTAISHLDSPPVDFAWIAVALSTGWAMSMTASPFSAVALLLGRITGHSAQRLTWGWNGAYSLIALAVLWILLWGLSRL
ncbi:MAG: hypothetical protein NXI16_13425 [Alphaproteobacteria bacterium]|nr:hypothetical protein [Alphaproteobacteria bacterium]